MGIIWLAFKSLLNFVLYQTVRSLFCPHQVTVLFFSPSIFWSPLPPPTLLSCLQISSLFFFLVLLRKTDPLEINSYVANMKQILSIGAEETIVCQFFQATIRHPLSDSGCCSIFEKSLCEWVVLSLQRFLCVGVCVCFSAWLSAETRYGKAVCIISEGSLIPGSVFGFCLLLFGFLRVGICDYLSFFFSFFK